MQETQKNIFHHLDSLEFQEFEIGNQRWEEGCSLGFESEREERGKARLLTERRRQRCPCWRKSQEHVADDHRR
jgi:hypothetical protein